MNILNIKATELNNVWHKKSCFLGQSLNEKVDLLFLRKEHVPLQNVAKTLEEAVFVYGKKCCTPLFHFLWKFCDKMLILFLLFYFKLKQIF